MFGSTKYGKRNKGGKDSPWHRRLVRAFKKDNHCHWCGIETIMGNRILEGGHQDRRAATLDHVYSSLDIRRLTKKGMNKIVLSCYYCNQKRNDKENRAVFSNDTDIRNNTVSIIDMLTTGEVKLVKKVKYIKI